MLDLAGVHSNGDHVQEGEASQPAQIHVAQRSLHGSVLARSRVVSLDYHPFLDEPKMGSRLVREMGWAEAGRGVEIQRQDEHIESWSVTLLSDLRNAHGFVLSQPIQGTNSAVDHLEHLVTWLERGVLREGDVLILDNASIHNSEEILGLVSLLLDAACVRMYFLPTYSPEFNPCEPVFAGAKRYLRCERGTRTFLGDPRGLWLRDLRERSCLLRAVY